MDFMTNGKVALAVTQCYCYPGKETFFRPDTTYPEYFFGKDNLSASKNDVYAAVRESLHLLELDEEHYGTKLWNPLKDFVKPGYTVLIKPNMVMDVNPSGEGTDCLYTQPSVVAPIVDYILIALQGKGSIIIGDAPMQECNFDKLIEESGYKALKEWYSEKGIDIKLMDFRGLFSKTLGGIHVQHINENAKGKVIDLGNDSEFAAIDEQTAKKLRVTNYDPAIMNAHHTAEKHEYFVADELLAADCIINMPKPKTHRLAGVTISMKNFVGISVRKEFLPHHTMGAEETGGDEYQTRDIIHAFHSRCLDKKNRSIHIGHRLSACLYLVLARGSSLAMKLKGKHYKNGAWYGNHTINKTIVDLNKIVRYANKSGQMCDTPQRKVLIVADMTVAERGRHDCGGC